MSRRSRRNNRMRGLLAGALLFSFLWYYGEPGQTPQIVSPVQHSEIADYYLVNAYSRRYDESGQLDTNLYADKATHYPRGDISQLQKPRMTLYDAGAISWTVTSDQGVIKEHGERVDLVQQVLAKSADELTTLKTPFMTIYPNQQQASTDKPVTLINPEGFTRATGMRADLAKEHVTLMSNVNGQYNAPR